MTPKEIVMSGYQSFSEGNMESLSKVFHKDAVIKINGKHKYSGEYRGFSDWCDNFLIHLPVNYPNFDLSIIDTISEGNHVHVRVRYKADNLDAEAVHMFVIENELQVEFTIFEDSQIIAEALSD